MITNRPGEWSQADNSVLSVNKVQNDFLSLLFFFDTVFLFGLLLFFAHEHLIDFSVLPVLSELCVSLSIKEHYVYVSMCSPASVTPVTGSVGSPCHRLSFHRPSESSVGVSALGDVGDFPAFYFNQCHVFVVPASVSLPCA